MYKYCSNNFFCLSVSTLWAAERMNKVLIFTIAFVSVLCLLSTFNVFASVNFEQVKQDSWPMFRHDPEHSGFSTTSVPQTNQTLWKQPTNGQVWSSPAISNGIVYVGSFDNSIYALNASTGTTLWAFPTSGEVYSSPAVFDGVVYVGSFDHNIYALNASTGSQLWNFQTGAEVFSSPTVVEGTVYIASDDGLVYALNAQTGKPFWNYTTSGEVQSSAAVSEGIVYIGSNDTNIYALNAITGKKLWNYTTASYVASSPVVYRGIVYVGSFDNNTYALNATTGDLIWNRTTGYDICMQSSPAAHGSAIYTGSSGILSLCSGYIDSFGNPTEDRIYALNAATGVTIWNITVQGGVWSSPAVSDTTICVGSGDNRLYALDISTGDVKWSYETSGTIYSSPAFADGVVYVGSIDHNIYAIGTAVPAVDSVKLDPFTIAIVVVALASIAAAGILLELKRRRK